MPNIATVLREEILRLARKEIRRQTNALRKVSAQYRKDIAEMKRRVSDLQRRVSPLEKQVLKGVSSQVPEVDAERVRFTAKGLRSQRQRLGLSAADCGMLLGVTDRTIYNWERGKARPPKQQLARMCNLRPRYTRRQLFRRTLGAMAAAALGTLRPLRAALREPADLVNETLAFIRRCAREDGGYAPSPDPAYPGYSDTSLSDLAGVTYAATLAKTMGWRLPYPERSIDYVKRRQQPDGSFVHRTGTMEPQSDLAVLYNTVQGVGALRALGQHPRIDPVKVVDRFFIDNAFEKLPWYTTSFFPLFYAALGKPFPERYDQALRRWQVGSPASPCSRLASPYGARTHPGPSQGIPSRWASRVRPTSARAIMGSRFGCAWDSGLMPDPSWRPDHRQDTCPDRLLPRIERIHAARPRSRPDRKGV